MGHGAQASWYFSPCAYSDAFICPLPSRQNILPFPAEAGEQQIRDHA